MGPQGASWVCAGDGACGVDAEDVMAVGGTAGEERGLTKRCVLPPAPRRNGEHLVLRA